MSSNIQSRSLGLIYQNGPLQIATGAIQNAWRSVVSLNEVVTTFETTSVTTGRNVETCYHPLIASARQSHLCVSCSLDDARGNSKTRNIE